jgi:hypothetical protein
LVYLKNWGLDIGAFLDQLDQLGQLDIEGFLADTADLLQMNADSNLRNHY